MKKALLAFVIGMVAMNSSAQRFMDKLDRGVVAVKLSTGVYVSWRIQADEYYDVTYNLYRDGTLVAGNLNTSNYKDAGGNSSSKYTVEAVKRGVKQAQSAAVTPWANRYLEITPKHPSEITSTLVPNDMCCADVDGDGQVEMLTKYDNWDEIIASYPSEGHNGEYTIFECLKLDGTVKWWVNCGPNMGDFQNNEQNIVAYDWDMDGKAEAIMRAADGTTIHAADGKTYVVGNASINYRAATGGGTNWFMHDGAEYLVYMNGETGVPYVIMDYPLKRLEDGETNLEKAWGDGYGHRSSKHFFGAPYLDGRKPSIFLGRGIYTRHKFVTFDVDPATHQLTERWRWTNNKPGSPWYGQGYHNYAVVDVDWDGRDEIVFGGLVIDDNGKGLSTIGLGHGDAQHHGDLNPYAHGQEGWFANEDHPGNHLRDLTTAKLYYRNESSRDDGRAIAGNFCKTVPGCIASSAYDSSNPISLVANKHVEGYSTAGMAQNFNCYWDGDLCEETFNYSNGKNTAGAIYKYGGNLLTTLEGSMTNNDTKGTPCFMGDILGDWRSEFIMRTADNKIRIYTTTIETPWRNYSLWYDHQYRNGMVWQMCGYNQPPHTSYFLGELEGITAAPPALTLQGRTEIANGGSIANNGDEVITCETNDMTVSIKDGATPYLYIDNAPSLVSGTAPSEATAASYQIKYTYYTHTLQGGGFAGTTRVVKQGDGILVYPEKDMTYSGNTDVWAGTLTLNGSIANSPLWMNRLTTLNTPAKDITVKSLVVDYGSTTTIGGVDAIGGLTATDSCKLGFGSRLKIDIYSDGLKADQVNTAKLIIETKEWKYGPEYKQPVIEFNCHYAGDDKTLAAGKYVLGKVAQVDGELKDIKIEGISKVKVSLALEDGILVMNVEGVRDAADIEWNGNVSDYWDIATTENFVTHDAVRAAETFIEGDNVYLTDNAEKKALSIEEGMEVKPANIYYTGTEPFVVSGPGKIAAGTFYNNGLGTVTMRGNNTYTGGNHLTSGITVVNSLSNNTQAYGNLGGVTTSPANFTLENGAVLSNTSEVTNGSAMRMVGNGVIKTNAKFNQQGIVTGDSLVKTGTGELIMSGNLATARTIVKAGSMDYSGNSYTKVVELQSNASISGAGFISSGLNISDGAKASVTTLNRKTSSNTLTGNGQVTIYCATEKGSNYYATRTPLQLKMNNFEGTLVAGAINTADGRFTLDTSSGSNKFTLNIPQGIIVQNSGKTMSIGNLTGSGTLGGYCSFSQGGSASANTWNVGNEKDFKFDGFVAGADIFNKVGDGTMTVSQAWQNSGTVRISEGVFVVTNSATLGTGALIVAENGTLMGLSSTTRSMSAKHAVTNSAVTVNGTLYTGSGGNATTGYWYFGTKPVTFGANSKLYVGIAWGATSATSPGCTHLWGDAANGRVTFKDGATICAYLSSSYDPVSSIGTDEQKADSFMVFNFPNATVGDVKFELPELPAGYYWDTDNFKNGYLYVRYSQKTGISSFAAGEMVTVDVFAANGVKVTSYISNIAEFKVAFHRLSLPKGVYILRAQGEKNNIETITLRK